MKTIIVALVFTFCVQVQITFATDGISYRLPNGKINVESYTVKIVPTLKEDSTFEGEVTVVVKALETIKCLTMNSKNLNIKELHSEIYRNGVYYKGFYKLLEDREMLELCFPKDILQNTGFEIKISFSGKIRDDFKGLYKVQYEENGSKKWLIAALLEPTYARMVFPCFDEPQYGAKFRWSIARYPDQTSLSVTNVKYTSREDSKFDNRVWDTFFETVPSAPYLMAFTVHSFTSRTENAGDFTIYSRKHADKDVDFFKFHYSKWYTKFTEYLNVYNYFNPYIDIVALPDGDEFTQKGTMMLYKEKDVFQIDGVDVEMHKEEIAKASIHKIYHLWMGAYVRPHWWSDTWLSESLGIYFQYLIANEVHPAWKLQDRFVTEVLQEALFEEDMHPDSVISSPTKTPSEIQKQKFNSFANEKGASIINMLQHVVGINFHQGFKNAIIKSHNSKLAFEPKNLWVEIDHEIKYKGLLPTDFTTETFMQTWLQSSGYPLITVLEECGKVVIKQEVYHSPTSTHKTPDHNWIVPIACEKQSTLEKQFVTWLHDSKPVTADYQLNKNEWILCNLNQGYYRVSYTNENWNLLIEQLKSQPDKIDHLARAQLIDDSFHLAISNKLSFSTAFNLGTYLEKESDMMPWFSFFKYITYFLRFYEKTDVIHYIKRYFLGIIKHQFERIGFEPRKDDSYTIQIGRTYILSIACQLGLSDCLDNSVRLYNTHIKDLTRVPAELKYVVYCNSFETLKDKQAAWDKLWEMYKNSKSMSEKELLLSSLACVNDEFFLKKLLKMAINSEEAALFQYEKECIIKSSAKFYKGVTSILELMKEIIPKLRFQSDKTYQTLMFMANEIYFNIHSSDHIEKTKEIVQQLENHKYDNPDLLECMKKSVDLGSRKIDYKFQNSDEIKQAIHDITGYDPPTTVTHSSTASAATQMTTDLSKVTTDTPKAPSSDCRVVPLTITYLIIIIGLISFIIQELVTVSY